MLDASTTPMASDSPPKDGRPLRLVTPTAACVGLAAVMSATATVDEKRYAWLIDAGLDPAVASMTLHAAPLVVTGVLVPLAAVTMRAMPTPRRLFGYGVAGMIVGFLTALCLNLFDGFVPLVEGLVGPLAAPTFWVMFGWLLTFVGFLQAGGMGLIAAFGTPAMRALSTQDSGVGADVDPRDRRQLGWAALGLGAQATATGGLTLLQQAMAPSLVASITLAVVMTGAVLVIAWCNWRLWRLYDELFRKIVVEAMAWSGALLTVFALVWAGLEGVGLSAPLSAYGLILLMVATQLLCATVLSLRLGLEGAR